VSKMDDTFSKGGDLNTPFLTTMKDCLKEAADVADKYAVESTTVKQLQTEVARQLEGKASRKIDYYKKAVPK
ncbi:hypothetical protein MKW94_014209, partial [Papaver nudicaule]|nr:hypothetical protein [Papaver nudicaule]